MLIYFAVAICAAALAFKVHRYDRFEREPWSMVLVALTIGFFAMKLAGAAEDSLLTHLRLPSDALAHKAIVVAVIEDSAKLLAVLLIACAFRRQFNDPLDGIIYGTLAGVGAAVEESLLYLSLATGPTLATLGAELTRLVAHSLMGGIAGFAVGIGARPDRARSRHPGLVATCLLASVALHFTWDFIAYQRTAHSPLLRAALMLLMLALILSWGALLAVAARRSGSIFTRASAAPPTSPARCPAAL